jgi:hypothetical protein
MKVTAAAKIVAVQTVAVATVVVVIAAVQKIRASGLVLSVVRVNVA